MFSQLDFSSQCLLYSAVPFISFNLCVPCTGPLPLAGQRIYSVRVSSPGSPVHRMMSSYQQSRGLKELRSHSDLQLIPPLVLLIGWQWQVGGPGEGTGHGRIARWAWSVIALCKLQSQLTSCCAAWSSTGHRTTPVHGPGVGDPLYWELYKPIIKICYQ